MVLESNGDKFTIQHFCHVMDKGAHHSLTVLGVKSLMSSVLSYETVLINRTLYAKKCWLFPKVSQLKINTFLWFCFLLISTRNHLSFS